MRMTRHPICTTPSLPSLKSIISCTCIRVFQWNTQQNRKNSKHPWNSSRHLIFLYSHRCPHSIFRSSDPNPYPCFSTEKREIIFFQEYMPTYVYSGIPLWTIPIKLPDLNIAFCHRASEQFSHTQSWTLYRQNMCMFTLAFKKYGIPRSIEQDMRYPRHIFFFQSLARNNARQCLWEIIPYL